LELKNLFNLSDDDEDEDDEDGGDLDLSLDGKVRIDFLVLIMGSCFSQTLTCVCQLSVSLNLTHGIVSAL
jgi:hypothetical protein